jgi:hypothetical protein
MSTASQYRDVVDNTLAALCGGDYGCLDCENKNNDPNAELVAVIVGNMSAVVNMSKSWLDQARGYENREKLCEIYCKWVEKECILQAAMAGKRNLYYAFVNEHGVEAARHPDVLLILNKINDILLRALASDTPAALKRCGKLFRYLFDGTHLDSSLPPLRKGVYETLLPALPPSEVGLIRRARIAVDIGSEPFFQK